MRSNHKSFTSEQLKNVLFMISHKFIWPVPDAIPIITTKFSIFNFGNNTQQYDQRHNQNDNVLENAAIDRQIIILYEKGKCSTRFETEIFMQNQTHKNNFLFSKKIFFKMCKNFNC